MRYLLDCLINSSEPSGCFFALRHICPTSREWDSAEGEGDKVENKLEEEVAS